MIKFKNRNFPFNSRNIKARLGFLISKAKLAFIKLRQAFVKAPILHYFDPKCYIQIETDVSGYAISRILNKLTLDDLDSWYLIAFFF